MASLAWAVTADSLLVALLVAIVAVVHLLPDEVPISVPVSRHNVLSATGGVSIVYAFVHLFPELDERQQALEGVAVLEWSLAAHHVYAVAFVGLAAFYGLERLAIITRTHDIGSGRQTEPVFWVHIGAFAVYNAFIGYALVQGETGADNTTLFAIAMAAHLFGNDTGLEGHHRDAYRRLGRWILTGAVLVGAGVGVVYTIDPVTLALLLALLTGGIVFNAIKDELPRTRESRFWPFAAGSIAYGLLLLVL
ncbi:hypothetical protein D8Y22_12115 [Salinadaptatus halalkaliphilus]|uniref:ZIP family metal transporter n=1 Tax=Salinadaptatus halalkaliphilus TaxID=2419781 RepID=A0A4V3VL81_9EURY|nr:hypothetical protein [Salinadaptatus halalkaliphilus]THE64567.1 hypothetical protein D8Y22_12115 [Salinadaptatus halalkaliphilus]